MTIAEKLPEMDAKDLAVLRTNALRWQSDGAPKQQAQAEDLLPLIDAELADRKAKAPPPPPKAPRKPSVRKAAAPKDPDPPKVVKPRASRKKVVVEAEPEAA